MASNDELKKMYNDAKKTVAGFVATATASCAVPIPVADAVVLVGEQVAMLAAISTIYKLGLSKKTLQTLVMGALGASGASVVGKTIVSSAFKLIPGMGTVAGSVISSTTAGALTLALGNAFIELCEAVKNGELTEKDLEGKKGKDYFKKFLNISKNAGEVDAMNYQRPKGKGFGKIIAACDVVMDGAWGKLIWDAIIKNEITFFDEQTQESKSMYICWDDDEAKKKYEELARKYKPTEADLRKREVALNKTYKSEVMISGLNRLSNMEPRTKISLDIYCDNEHIGYLEIISNNESKLTMKEIQIKEEFRGKGLYTDVIERVRSSYYVVLSPEVINDEQYLD